MGRNSPEDWVASRYAHSRMSAAEKRRPGWKLKNWRLQNGITQTQAAKLFGCSQEVLSQYERGTRDPHGDHVVRAIQARTGVRWT